MNNQERIFLNSLFSDNPERIRQVLNIIKTGNEEIDEMISEAKKEKEARVFNFYTARTMQNIQNRIKK